MEIERLRYGKLVTSDDGRVPNSEGYGVTSRSSGLDATDDEELRLAKLFEVKRFEADLVDPVHAATGILLVRYRPAAGRPSREVVFVRARFRSEYGEGAAGRLYQQATIWVVRESDWQHHPAVLLEHAAEKLRAIPDRIDIPRAERFDLEPERVATPEVAGKSLDDLSPGSLRILDAILPAAGPVRPDAPDVQRGIIFGSDTYPSEAEFLRAVGDALQVLPEEFEGWHDIVIAAGLRRAVWKTCIRYLGSLARTAPADPVDVEAIRKRIDGCRGSYLSSATHVPCTDDRPPARGEQERASLAPVDLPGVRPCLGAAWREKFALFMADWRAYLKSPERANILHARAREVASLLREGSVEIEEHKQQHPQAWGALHVICSLSTLQPSPAELPLGHLLDLGEFCARLSGVAAARAGLLAALINRLVELDVLFEAEVAALEMSALRDDLSSDHRLSCLFGAARIARSEDIQIAGLRPVGLDPNPRRDPVLRLIARLRRAAGARAAGQNIAPRELLGIHGKYPVERDAILCASEYSAALEGFITGTLPGYLDRRTPRGHFAPPLRGDLRHQSPD
jgi:hypothetical protein